MSSVAQAQESVMDLIWTEMVNNCLMIVRYGGADNIRRVVAIWQDFQMRHELMTLEYAAKQEALLDQVIAMQSPVELDTLRERTLHLVAYEDQLRKTDGMSDLMRMIGDECDVLILQEETDLLEEGTPLRQFLQKVIDCLVYRVALRSTTIVPMVQELTEEMLNILKRDETEDGLPNSFGGDDTVSKKGENSQ